MIRKIRSYSGYIIPLVLALALLVVGAMTTPASAEVEDDSTPDSCITDTSSPDPGADICTLHAGGYYMLNATDWMEVNITANDGLPTDEAIKVKDIGTLDENIALLELYKNSAGAVVMDLIINYDYVGKLSTTYTDAAGQIHTLNINVLAYVPPPTYVGPTVKLATAKGRLNVCEPSADAGGTNISWLYGSYKDPSGQPDGQRIIPAGECRKVRVHRHHIDWEAYELATGYFVAGGKIGHIPLPAGDQPPVHKILQRSSTMASAWSRYAQ